MIFSRLQRGKPLQLGERLNALPGDTVMRMREIAEHPFMKHSIGINKSRYGNYPDAARVLYYGKLKIRIVVQKNYMLSLIHIQISKKVILIIRMLLIH